MSQEIIDTGSLPNDGNGDPLRTAFDKINNNFANLFTLAVANPNAIQLLDPTANQTLGSSFNQINNNFANLFSLVTNNPVDPVVEVINTNSTTPTGNINNLNIGNVYITNKFDSRANNRWMLLYPDALPSVAGEVAVTYTDANTVTTGLSVVDGSYTINNRYNGNWTVSTPNSNTSGTGSAFNFTNGGLFFQDTSATGMTAASATVTLAAANASIKVGQMVI
jgi:hypothetical protein